jgi:hypothetical protein
VQLAFVVDVTDPSPMGDPIVTVPLGPVQITDTTLTKPRSS